MNGTSLRSLSLAPHASFGWERGQSFQRPGRGRCHSASPPLEGEVTWGGSAFAREGPHDGVFDDGYERLGSPL